MNDLKERAIFENFGSVGLMVKSSFYVVKAGFVVVVVLLANLLNFEFKRKNIEFPEQTL